MVRGLVLSINRPQTLLHPEHLLNKLIHAAQVEKAPQESYADVGGLEQQIMEIKEAVELPLTHPELYERVWVVRG